MNKIAVLSPSEAKELFYSHGIVDSAKPSDLLLALLRKGYEVIVISSRSELDWTDRCWSDLIGKENTYLPASRDETDLGYADPKYFASWFAVAKKYGLRAPIVTFDLLSWRDAFKEQGVLGSSIPLMTFA